MAFYYPFSALLIGWLFSASCAIKNSPPPRLQGDSPATKGSDTFGPREKIEATDHGITISDGFPPNQVLTVELGRYLRLDGEVLYFFDLEFPILRSVHLKRRGTTKTVLRMPQIDHPDFQDPDLLSYVHRQQDLDIRNGVLCIDLKARGVTGGPTCNIRIELDAMTFKSKILDDRLRDERLCIPNGPSGDGLSIRL